MRGGEAACSDHGRADWLTAFVGSSLRREPRRAAAPAFRRRTARRATRTRASSRRIGSGVRATITARATQRRGRPRGRLDRRRRPGPGANGETMWLQTGVAAMPGTPLMVYAEVARTRAHASFVPLHEDVAVGESHRLAVLEMNSRPGFWRVWLDGRPVTDPVPLPGSHRRWEPLATAESWNAGAPRATASASASSGSAWPGRSAARGSPSCPATRSATADTRCGS